jgi:hypothetical protein
MTDRPDPPLAPPVRAGFRAARGSRVVVRADAPAVETRGRTCLVLDDHHEDDPSVAVVSFDEMPTVLALVPHEHLLPLDSKLCVSSDPGCSMLEPCQGCVVILRAHLGQALRQALSAEQAGGFVAEWNRLRVAERERVRVIVAEARAWAEKAASSQRSALSEEVSAQPSRPADALKADALTAADALREPGSPGSPHPPVEKKRSTRGKGPRKKAAPRTAAVAEVTPPIDAAAAAGTVRGDEAVGPTGEPTH